MSNYQLGKVLFQTLEKKDVVSPIHKSGGKTMVSNYKPISILLVLSKVSEKWVAEHLKTLLNLGHNPLHPMQFGFCTNHSTETANCFLLENIKSQLDGGGIVGALFFDLKKAFDTVNHQTLLSSLACTLMTYLQSVHL
jgi:sarcosine oxidase/L-pipecolate oxidase